MSKHTFEDFLMEKHAEQFSGRSKPMSLKRCYIKCAKILPYLRKCKSCNHTCALRMFKFVDFEVPLFADSHEEKAISSFNDDNRDRIKESIVLGIDESNN